MRLLRRRVAQLPGMPPHSSDHDYSHHQEGIASDISQVLHVSDEPNHFPAAAYEHRPEPVM